MSLSKVVRHDPERPDRRPVASLDDWRGPTLARLRQLFQEVDPEVVEEWKYMGSPAW